MHPLSSTTSIVFIAHPLEKALLLTPGQMQTMQSEWERQTLKLQLRITLTYNPVSSVTNIAGALERTLYVAATGIDIAIMSICCTFINI